MRQRNDSSLHAQNVANLIDRFAGVVDKVMFEVTNRKSTQFEGGTYGHACASPTQRMKNALSVDREILVVASTFREQQARIIKFAERLIEESKGRLEPSLAIVLHCDNDGDAKLRKWGRGRGITVLAVKDGYALTNREFLEQTLCRELYGHDPFDVTGPVIDDRDFYGRREEAITMARKLQTGQIRSFLGIRKVGKTSILNRIIREITSNSQCHCLMVDCSKDEIFDLNASRLMSSIAATAKQLVETDGEYATLAPSRTELVINEARAQLESVFGSLKRPLIIIFDEVDYITPGSPTKVEWRREFNPFWRNLRAAYQETSRQNTTVSMLVAGVSVHWFTVGSIDGVENAALQLIPEEYLSPMAAGATVAMLRKLGKSVGLTFSDAVAEHIAEKTANMPYWTRKCCSHINRSISVADRPCEVQQDQAIRLVEQFIREEGTGLAEVALQHLFSVHPDLEDAVRKFKEGHSDQVSERHKRVLRQYGIVNQSDQCLAGAMVEAGFASLEQAKLAEPNSPQSQVGHLALKLELGEWAEEVSAVSRRRNLIEKRMRDLVLGLLRADCLSKGAPQELRGRILCVFPEKTRKHYENLSAEDALGKLYWKDLVNLIVKNWSLVERVFGDQQEFRKNCELVNDRPDAHAKNADRADFALYRRALSHLEEALGKLS